MNVRLRSMRPCSTGWNDLNFWLAIAKVVDGNQPGLVYLGLLPAGIPIGSVSGCGSPGAVAAARGGAGNGSNRVS